MVVVVVIVWVRLMWQEFLRARVSLPSFSIFSPFEIPQVTFGSQLANFRVRGSPLQKFVARIYDIINLQDVLGVLIGGFCHLNKSLEQDINCKIHTFFN